MIGEVKWFEARKGYGFIVDKDGQDYFVHYKQIRSPGNGYKTLEKGWDVEFEVETGDRGKSAVNVRRIDGDNGD